MIYLATAFTHPNKEVMDQRLASVTEANFSLVEKGIPTISPVFYGCALSEKCDNQDLTWTTWEKFCKNTLDKCTMMIVLNTEGWDKSTGVREEIEYCHQKSIPVFLLTKEEISNFDGSNLKSYIQL